MLGASYCNLVATLCGTASDGGGAAAAAAGTNSSSRKMMDTRRPRTTVRGGAVPSDATNSLVPPSTAWLQAYRLSSLRVVMVGREGRSPGGNVAYLITTAPTHCDVH